MRPPRCRFCKLALAKFEWGFGQPDEWYAAWSTGDLWTCQTTEDWHDHEPMPELERYAKEVSDEVPKVR
jgi:hypothetical protein